MQGVETKSFLSSYSIESVTLDHKSERKHLKTPWITLNHSEQIDFIQ